MGKKRVSGAVAAAVRKRKGDGAVEYRVPLPIRYRIAAEVEASRRRWSYAEFVRRAIIAQLTKFGAVDKDGNVHPHSRGTAA